MKSYSKCVWLLALHNVFKIRPCCCIGFFFIAEISIVQIHYSMCILSPIDGQCGFPFLAAMNKMAINIFALILSFGGHMFSSLRGKYFRVELLEHRKVYV